MIDNNNLYSPQIGGGAKQKRVKFLFITIVFFFSLIILPSFVSAVLLSDQGTDVIDVSTGNLTTLANLTISIYDNLTGGNLIFEQNFTDAIANGSWNIMIDPSLEYGRSYWKDYQINGEDLDFDGNERLKFQSPLGLINNESFINFSLINSCSAGSSIRLIYENGSVECETDDDSGGSGSSNLTNYALKNQSEIFEGNITTSQTGFFGWLGSLASRITKIFAQDIDASGDVDVGNNVNVTGNVTANYFKGDGSLLNNLPAGSESDPIFVAENTTLWNAINSKLDENDQRYNDTTLILSVNTTSNIMSLDFYNKSEVDNLILGVEGGNSSFNQSLTDTLYYSITNPLNFINTTTGQVFNDTVLVLNVNSSLWNHINTNEVSWLSTYNLTYTTYAYNQTTPAITYADNINTTLSSRIDGISEGNESFNQTLTDSIYIAQSEEANLNVNSSTWWASVSGWVSGWFVNNAGNLEFNETKLNDTIDSRDSDTTYSHLTNFTDDLGNRGYTSLSNFTNDKDFINSTQVSAYNETNYIDGIVSDNNASWTSTYNLTYDSKVSDNSSWNQSLADTLYADISVTGDNSSWNESHARTIFYDAESDLTGLLDDNYADISVTGDNSSWNESHADTLYADIQWGYNMTTPFTNWLSTFVYDYNQTAPANVYSDNINTTLSSRIDGISEGNASFNQTLTDSLYSGIEWDYNQTEPAQDYADTQINAVNTTENIDSLGYLNKSGTNANQDVNISPYNFQAGNLTLTQKITFSLGEIIDNIVNGWITITGSLQVSGDVNVTGNITTTDTFCFTADCSAKMYHNGSGIIITS